MPNSAATVAVATPCWPAPVSAISRRLAHAPRQQRLPDGVVDLVRAGVVQIFALQVKPRAAAVRRQPLRKIQRRRPPHVIAQDRVELRLKGWVRPRRLKGRFQLNQGRHERLTHISPTELTKVPEIVRFKIHRVASSFSRQDHASRFIAPALRQRLAPPE